MAQTNVPFCSDAYDTNFAVVYSSLSPCTVAAASAVRLSVLSVLHLRRRRRRCREMCSDIFSAV